MRCRLSFSTRRDQLLYMENIANELLPAPHVLHDVKYQHGHYNGPSNSDHSEHSSPVEPPSYESHSPSPKRFELNVGDDGGDPELAELSCHPDSTIALFDFVSRGRFTYSTKYSIQDYHKKCWQYLNLPWSDRVGRMVQDVEERNESGAYLQLHGLTSESPRFLATPVHELTDQICVQVFSKTTHPRRGAY